jgi:DNA gyrase subunit A
VTAVEAVHAGDDLVIMSERGKIMRTPIADVSTVGRNTMGVTVMGLDDADGVACIDVIPGETK